MRSEGVASISFRKWSTNKWEKPLSKAKPFCISKRVVFEAYKRVRANRGAAGVDGESIAEFDKDLKNNLYKVWNRMFLGSYFPPAARSVEIAKKSGGQRKLGVPTVSDRIAQMVAKMYFEPEVEDLAHMFNPVIRGWINYYSQFYKSALYPILKRLNNALQRWACRKYKKLHGRKRKALKLLQRVAKQMPHLFVHWRFVGQLAGR
jgi:hypothetical protein